MQDNIAAISLGSNIRARANIARARTLINLQHPIIKESCFVRTKPIGITNQPDFLNGVVLIRTPLTRSNLKKSLRAIEKKLGRKRNGPKFGSRPIDLDIVVWNGRIIDPDFFKRDFLKAAVLEILPELSSLA